MSKILKLKGLINHPFDSLSRKLSIGKRLNANVTVIGANGNIGQPLSLLLKLNPLVQNLSLYDITDTEGISLDLSHVDTSTQIIPSIRGNMLEALENADIVVIPAGFPRKPGMSRDDLLDKNAQIVFDVILALKKLQKLPILAVITNPVNSIIPFMFQILSSKKLPFFKDSDIILETLLKKRLMGVSTLDCVRASTFYAEYLNEDPSKVVVPVIGGHSDTTMIPLFSQSNIPLTDSEVVKKLTQKVREAGTKVVEAKKGKGSASLSMAYAANRFLHSILESFHGKKIIECSYVKSQAHVELPFFAEICHFDNSGVNGVIPLEGLNSVEQILLAEIVQPLKNDIDKGITLADKYLEKLKESDIVNPDSIKLT